MKSLILQTGTRYLTPLLLLFSIFLLLRGHHDPGGGFVGGLVAASAFILYAIAYDSRSLWQNTHIRPHHLIATGLLLAVGSGLLPLVMGNAFMTGQWDTRHLPAIGKLGTPLMFDTGVYLLVIGVALLILLTLIEDDREEQA